MVIYIYIIMGYWWLRPLGLHYIMVILTSYCRVSANLVLTQPWGILQGRRAPPWPFRCCWRIAPIRECLGAKTGRWLRDVRRYIWEQAMTFVDLTWFNMI
jgi:hypothetical protein